MNETGTSSSYAQQNKKDNNEKSVFSDFDEDNKMFFHQIWKGQ